uniref:Uncharacterized protein n=1 Tax=Rhizophora mucronata TaxID=61149 RepID=A0A2P2QA87_RHIMU
MDLTSFYYIKFSQCFDPVNDVWT